MSKTNNKELERVWRLAHRDELLAYHKAYYRAHREEQLAAANAAYRENREAKLAYARKRYKADPSIARKWAKDNPERHLEAVRVRVNRRRALKASAPGSGVTPKQWAAIKDAYGHRCAYCGKQPARLTMDHVDSLISGGAHDPLNVVPACSSCNSQKHDDSIILWLARRAS